MIQIWQQIHPIEFLRRKLRDSLVISLVGSFGLSASDQLFRFITGVLLAQMLGVEAYGKYTYIFAWVSILVTIAQLGLDRLILREIPRTLATNDLHSFRGVVQFTYTWTMRSSFIVSTCGILFFLWSGQIDKSEWLVWVSILLIISSSAFMRLSLAILRGLHMVIKGQIADKLVQPIIMLFGLATVSSFSKGTITPAQIIIINASATAVACFYSINIMWRNLPSVVTKLRGSYLPQMWWRVSTPMFLTMLLSTLNTQLPILMLGWLTEAAAVGIYAVANRMLLPVLLIVSTFNTSLSSPITKLYYENRYNELQNLITSTARLQFWLTVILVLVLGTFSQKLLQLFGKDFIVGQQTMIWLLVGQLVNAATGPVGTLLTLSGHERQTLVGLLIGILTNLLLNYYLIPYYGYAGSAISTTISLSFWNIGLVIYSVRVLKIDTSIIGWRSS